MSARVPYTLKHPIKRTIGAGTDNERVEEIADVQLGRIKGKHLKAFGKRESEEHGVLILIAGCAGLLEAEVGEMDAEDIGAIGDIVENFMPPGLRTGTPTSET